MESPFDLITGYKSIWHKASSYILFNEFIRPSANASFETFSPYKYYYEPLSHKQTTEIFGWKCSTELRLHTAFASLDPNDPKMLLRWCNNFGIPYTSYYHPTLYPHIAKNFPSEFNKELADNQGWDLREDCCIKSFSEEIQIFKSMLDIKSAILKRDFEYLAENKKKNYCGENTMLQTLYQPPPSPVLEQYLFEYERSHRGEIPVHGETKEIGSLIANGIYNIECIINRGLEGIKITETYLDQDKNKLYYRCQPKEQFQFTSLLSAIYSMVHLDTIKGKSMKICSNEYCGNYFIARIKAAKYCSKECQERAKSRRSSEKSKQHESQQFSW